MHNWLKIDATGAVYVPLLKYLQLAQIMHIPVEIVAIGSDYAHSN